MRTYKIVRYCRYCKKKFWGKTNKYVETLCPECYKKYGQKED